MLSGATDGQGVETAAFRTAIADGVNRSLRSIATFSAVPAADRPKLLESAAGVEKRLQADVPMQDQAAVAA
jgi:hypothetical protein